MTLLEIAVVHHRTPDVLRTCLTRLAQWHPDIPVHVYDTGPSDDAGEPAMLEALAVHPHASLHGVPNVSYAATVNAALHHAQRGENDGVVIVANADAFIERDTIPAMLAPFRDPQVGVTGPLGRTPAGTLQDQGLPYRLVTRSLEGNGPHAVRDAPWLSGFLFAVRLAAVRHAGGMDERFRFTNEDLEWSLRLRTAGWRVVLVGAEATHLGGSSTPDAGRFLVEGLRGGMLVAKQHGGPMRAAIQRIVVWLWAELRARSAADEQRSSWRAVARMMRHGRFDESPFGSTLAEDAPGFPDAWPSR